MPVPVPVSEPVAHMHMQDICRSSHSRPMAILTLPLGRRMDECYYLAGGLDMLTPEVRVSMRVLLSFRSKLLICLSLQSRDGAAVT